MAFPESGIFSGVSTSITDVNCHLTLTKGKKTLLLRLFNVRTLVKIQDLSVFVYYL